MKVKVECEKEVFGIRAGVSLKSKAGEPKEGHILSAIELPLAKIDDTGVERLFPSTEGALKWAETTVSRIQMFMKSMREDLPPPWEIDV